VTSDGGLILIRELDERLDLEQLIEEEWSDSRQVLNKQFMLLRGPQRLRTIGSGPDVSIDQFAEDLGPGQGADLDLALVRNQAVDQRRESDRVDGGEPGDAGQAECLDSSDRVVLDMDSSESLVRGQQEGCAYNGHFETVWDPHRNY
jgi:hypothetical protein